MNVVIACECSGMVRRAFQARGHWCISIDLKPADDGVVGMDARGGHIVADAFDGITQVLADRSIDLLVAHPECRYLCSSGLHWNTRGRIESDGRPRSAHTADALAFALRFVDLYLAGIVPRLILENSIGALSRALGKPTQIVQPHQFGDDASKATALWLFGPVAKLVPTRQVQPRLVCSCGYAFDVELLGPRGCPNCCGDGKILPRWANQTDGGQNRLPPSPNRSALRAATYPGIAEALAAQVFKTLDAGRIRR